MQQKTISISIALFIVIVVGMFVFAYLKKTEVKQNTSAPIAEQKQDGEVKYASITRITAKHYFENGVHTLAGEIEMPTPCDLVEANARVMESFPEQVAIDFNVINNAQVCSQQITMQRFKVTANASKDATFSATLMGRTVLLNLIPAGIGEKPEDFELFIKG